MPISRMESVNLWFHLPKICSGHCKRNCSILHKDEHIKMKKHKKLLNLLCIVYTHVRDFYNRNLFLTAKLLKQVIYIMNFVKDS